jgi:DNA-binding response OmpR family regulator
MRILIADDENSLRELLADFLIAKGHEVVSAKDGAEALRIFLNDEGEFDYVITDYQMPRKNGVVLIMDIRKAVPGQKCILVTGDPPQLSKAVREDAGEFPVLRKPYDRTELLGLLK